MTTLHITVDDQLAEAARQQAALQGRTVEAVVAELVAKWVSSGKPHDVLDEFIAIARVAGGNSGGQKWTRDELYDE
ncbi:MAG TPA: hypothetical protein VM008_10280 [Phycisphaerae bacterium]|nr:hypothetical protein [Phycisphaerae bacterium]